MLTAVRDAAVSCKQSLGGERREDPEGAAGRKVAQAALDEVADTAVRLLNAFDEPDAARRRDVVWLAEQGPDAARSRVLRVAPLAVGGLLRERLFGRSTVVLTSATLTLGGTFDALARQWGLAAARSRAGRPETDDRRAGPGRPEAGRGSTSARRSSTRKSGILYVAKHLPPPGRDGLPPRVPRRDRRAGRGGGRADPRAVLLDARRQAGHRGAARAGCDTPLLCQGDDATMLLVRRFAEDEATSLFGTLSLWQGVDVPGPSLSLRDHRPDPVPAARTTRWCPPGSAPPTPAAATAS